MTGNHHPMVQSYLKRLETAMASVPREERAQIIDGIEEHITASLAESPAPTEADVRNVLDRVGDPDVIAADARGRVGVRRSRTHRLTSTILWVGAAIGVLDLLMVATSQVGPIEFAILAVPVVALVVLAVGLRRFVRPV